MNDEPTKAPTIDLFDMLNTSDYREEKYVYNLSIKLSLYGSLIILFIFFIDVTIKRTNNFIQKKVIYLNSLILQDFG